MTKKNKNPIETWDDGKEGANTPKYKDIKIIGKEQTTWECKDRKVMGKGDNYFECIIEKCERKSVRIEKCQ